MEKNCVLTHSSSLFDVPGTEVVVLHNMFLQCNHLRPNNFVFETEIEL